MLLLDAGLSATVLRQASVLKNSTKELLEFKNILRSVEGLFIIIALVIILGIYLNSHFIADKWLDIKLLDTNEVAYCISLMGLMIGFKWISSVYKGAINGFEHQVWINIYLISINTLKFVGGFLVVKYISQDIGTYFEYQLTIGVLELVVIHHKLYKLLPKTDYIVKPSLTTLKSILPFALGIAYTSGLWIVISQIDKLLLSNILPLEQYGYFTLVVVVVNGIGALSGPIGMAISPRLTSLVAQGKIEEMIKLYKQSTQYVAIIAFSVAAVIAVYSKELLYAWTGNMTASLWASDILFWYALGNAALMMITFQYFLQFAYGNLKYHIWGSSILGIMQIVVMVFAVNEYGAIGAGKAWFFLQLTILVVWPAYIHSKFAKGIHLDWFFKDIMPFAIMTMLTIYMSKLINIDFFTFTRFEIFGLLVCIGVVVLSINAVLSENIRKILTKKVFK
jgi:O-antigen/teichoic acid export membrane protein